MNDFQSKVLPQPDPVEGWTQMKTYKREAVSYLNASNKLHRVGKPAYQHKNGELKYMIDGEYHREDGGPARVDDEGTQSWYVHGARHRGNDKPAVMFKNGRREWWVNGKRHREPDAMGNPQPAIIDEDGQLQFWRNGKRFIPELDEYIGKLEKNSDSNNS